MNVAGSYVTVMLIAGALSGLAGSAQALGGNNVAITGDVDASIGFDAITVALLGRASPGGTVLAGILFGALRAGAVRMQAETGVPTEIVQVIQSVIVLFIAAPALIRAIFRLRAVGVAAASAGWRRGGTDDRADVSQPTRNWSSSGTSSMSGCRCARG